jgi:hypothetical protein
MITTCSSVAVVKNKFHFFVNKAPMKNAIYMSTIESVIKDDIISSPMAYSLMLIARSRGRALQSMEID